MMDSRRATRNDNKATQQSELTRHDQGNQPRTHTFIILIFFLHTRLKVVTPATKRHTRLPKSHAILTHRNECPTSRFDLHYGTPRSAIEGVFPNRHVVGYFRCDERRALIKALSPMSVRLSGSLMLNSQRTRHSRWSSASRVGLG